MQLSRVLLKITTVPANELPAQNAKQTSMGSTLLALFFVPQLKQLRKSARK